MNQFDSVFTVKDDETYFSTAILVCGNNDTDRIKLVNHLTNIMESREVEMIIPNTVDEFIEVADKLHREMMHRFMLMEKEQVNHASKIKSEKLTAKCLVINDINAMYLSGEDVAILRTMFNGIVRLGKAAGIYAIIGCPKFKVEVITSDLSINVITRFYVGEVLDPIMSKYQQYSKRSSASPYKHIPDDYTLCYSSGKVTLTKIDEIT